jgi:hypothetical protein
VMVLVCVLVLERVVLVRVLVPVLVVLIHMLDGLRERGSRHRAWAAREARHRVHLCHHPRVAARQVYLQHPAPTCQHPSRRCL